MPMCVSGLYTICLRLCVCLCTFVHPSLYPSVCCTKDVMCSRTPPSRPVPLSVL